MGFVGWTIHNKHHNWKITMFHGRTPISACSSTMFDGYINVVKYLNYLPQKNLFFIIFPIYETSMFPVFSLWILHFPLLRDPIFFIPLRWLRPQPRGQWDGGWHRRSVLPARPGDSTATAWDHWENMGFSVWHNIIKNRIIGICYDMLDFLGCNFWDMSKE